jgi:hypothetical protein
MDQCVENRLIQTIGGVSKRAIFKIGMMVFAVCILPGFKAYSQKTDKIQQMIDAIKAVNNNGEEAFITDGQRVVWVKSYKKWTPQDLVVMKKEDPTTLKFLSMAAQRARYDVLEQLLPDYYREHGGAKAFATDIMKEQVAPPTSITKEKS